MATAWVIIMNNCRKSCLFLVALHHFNTKYWLGMFLEKIDQSCMCMEIGPVN